MQTIKPVPLRILKNPAHKLKPGYLLVRWGFLRGLGLVYLMAFLSLWPQITGLIGQNGVLPFSAYLTQIHQSIGLAALWRVPTLAWVWPDNLMLHAICGAGVFFAALLTAGLIQRFALLALWVLYLSVVSVGQTFLSFQWDNLLLEMGFLAIWMVPWSWRMSLHSTEPPPLLGVWAYRLLLFRFFFASGLVKLTSGDSWWRTFQALSVHYETQPLPHLLSWYAHHMPGWFHQACTGLLFVVELILPFLLFGPRRIRWIAFAGFVCLQLGILLTGNYGFFNLLTLVLCLWALDDRHFPQSLLPMRFRSETLVRNQIIRQIVRDPEESITRTRLGDWYRYDWPIWKRKLNRAVIFSVMVLGVLQLRHAIQRGVQLPAPVHQVETITAPFRSVNPYGLFAMMTSERPEIQLEGSLDGRTWYAYEFRHKPGDPSRRPVFTTPHMPRLDWQMWFAALSYYRASPWVMGLMRRLLAGEPEVTSLLKTNPFRHEPPRYVRALMYQYRFTTPDERAAEGLWWKRRPFGLYSPVLSR